MKPLKLVIPWYTALALSIVFVGAGMGIAKLLHDRNVVPYSCDITLDSDNDYIDTTGEPPAAVLPPSQGIEITKAEFDTLSDKFIARNPELQGWLGNHGGKIGKEAVQLLLSSLSPDDNHIEFMFGYDSTSTERRTSLLLRGGTRGTGLRGGERLMIRNGGTTDTYCPMICPVR